jgi:BolA protein
MQQQIESKIAESIQALHLQVVNESGNHNVPEGSESHFKVVLVSPEFSGLSLLQRHKRVNSVLSDELKQIHALALHTYTEDEWNDRFAEAPMSPPCLGGSKA